MRIRLARFPRTGDKRISMDSASLPARRRPHIVDVLIAERAPRLTASPFWPVLRPGLYGVLGYGAAVKMADAIESLSGAETLEHVSNLLRLSVTTTNLDRLPATGRCVVVCNHPTGIADGVAVYDAIKQRRADRSRMGADRRFAGAQIRRAGRADACHRPLQPAVSPVRSLLAGTAGRDPVP